MFGGGNNGLNNLPFQRVKYVPIFRYFYNPMRSALPYKNSLILVHIFLRLKRQFIYLSFLKKRSNAKQQQIIRFLQNAFYIIFFCFKIRQQVMFFLEKNLLFLLFLFFEIEK